MAEIIPADLKQAMAPLFQYCGEMYIVGGAIRDWFLGRKIKDIDFVVEKNASLAAKRIADHFHGSFYILDEKRQTSRALITLNEQPLKIDFALLNGESIQADLYQRDFTINSIAFNVSHPEVIIDPLKGKLDLGKAVLKPCSKQSFILDPIRAIRAVRFINDFDLQLTAGADEQIIAAVPLLKNISGERKRDELFRIFESKDAARSMELLQKFQMWPELFPMIEKLEQIACNVPHIQDGLRHSLSVLNYCQILLNCLMNGKKDDRNPFIQSGLELLDRYQQGLREFFERPINPERRYDGLIYLAAIYHDIGKTKIPPKMKEGMSIFPDHAKTSAEVFKKICPHWALSKHECSFIQNLIASHTLPSDIQEIKPVDARKALHRFYRQYGKAGMLQGIFHMADILATYEEKLTQERWQRALQTSDSLLKCWYEQYSEIVDPPVLLNGEDLLRNFGLKKGKEIGRLLGKLLEAQAAGEVTNKQEAMKCIQNLINNAEEEAHG